MNARAIPKDPRDYTVLGKSVPRYDLPTKVTGEFQYVQHVRVPGITAISEAVKIRPPKTSPSLSVGFATTGCSFRATSTITEPERNVQPPDEEIPGGGGGPENCHQRQRPTGH